MNFILENWMIVLAALASGGLLLWPTINGAGQTGLSAGAAVQLINRERAVVIDVCEPAEFAAGHVSASKNIPLGELETRLPTTVKNKNLPLVLVCASGIRSKKALAIANKLGYAQAQVLAGGMKSWREANLPVEKV